MVVVIAALVPTVGDSAASVTPAKRNVVTETLGAPGAYSVGIRVSSLSGRARRVTVRVNGTMRGVVKARSHRLAHVSLNVTAAGAILAVHAVGAKNAHLRLAVSTVPTTAPGSTKGSTGSSGASAGPPDLSSWHEIFDDEFTQPSLNTSMWSTGWYGTGLTGPIDTTDELACYDPSHVVLGSGELDINLTATPESCQSGSGMLHEPYASGMITTRGRFTFTYGYIEARVWLPGKGQISDWPAVWAIESGGSWPADGELDILEGLSGKACFHFHNSSGGPGGCAQATFTGGWHTFGADWEPGIVTWYYDGVQVGDLTSGVTSWPMYLLLDLSIDHVYGGPIQAPATTRFDYLRVWQH